MNIVLFGVGPHAKRIYLKYIQKVDFIDKVLIVDLKHRRKAIEEVVNKFDFDYELLLFDSVIRDDEALSDVNRTLLLQKISDYDINHAIISTEPKSHMMYIDFCLEVGLSIMCDKPITASIGSNTEFGSQKLLDDYYKIVKKYRQSNSKRFDVMAQRRGHEGFHKAFDIVNEVVCKYKVPITKLRIMHGDGNWPMPNEVILRDNHPYKYGYGKLLHSGYHFVDLISIFLRANKNAGLNFDSRELKVSDYLTSDFMAYFNGDFYNRLGKEFKNKERKEIFDSLDVLDKFGELDVSAIVDYKDRNGRILTQAVLDMSQSSYSRRAWFEEPKDTYKGNGRIRHEYVEIDVGPLLNVKIMSFQSKEISEEKEMINSIGSLDHFEIDVFRNDKLIGGKPFERILTETRNKDDHYIGQNEQARFDILDRFFNNEPSDATLEDQEETIILLSEFYKSMSKRFSTKNSLYDVEIHVKNGNKLLKVGKKHEAQYPSGEILNYESIETAIKRILKTDLNIEISNPQKIDFKIENGRLTYIYDAEISCPKTLHILNKKYDWAIWEEN